MLNSKTKICLAIYVFSIQYFCEIGNWSDTCTASVECKQSLTSFFYRRFWYRKAFEIWIDWQIWVTVEVAPAGLCRVVASVFSAPGSGSPSPVEVAPAGLCRVVASVFSAPGSGSPPGPVVMIFLEFLSDPKSPSLGLEFDVKPLRNFFRTIGKRLRYHSVFWRTFY